MGFDPATQRFDYKKISPDLKILLKKAGIKKKHFKELSLDIYHILQKGFVHELPEELKMRDEDEDVSLIKDPSLGELPFSGELASNLESPRVGSIR